MDGFKLIHGAIIAVIALTVVITFFLGAQCYISGDPNNIACYMISERYDIRVR